MLSARIKMWGALILGFMALLAGCGSSSNNATPATTTVYGSVYAAPVSGATVTIKDGNGNVLAANVHSGSNGTYSASIPSSAVSSTLIFESGGGTYSDEATGLMTTAGRLAAYVPAGSLSSGASVNLDPTSTIVAGLVATGKTHADAKTSFASAFGFTPDCSVQPVNAPYSASSTTAQRLAALRAMAFSQLTMDLGQGPDKQFNLLNALVDDLVDDGILNGSSLVSIGTTTLPEDIQNRFECALVSFLTNTVRNLTGLSSGELGDWPFGKVALTNSYKVEYLPGMMGASMGKTMFQIRITDRANGNKVTNLVGTNALTLMTKMHMPTSSHGTPVDVITEDGGNPGTYNCAIYYLMASGPNMGFWELKVMIGSGTKETATFYPRVGMAMGSDTIIQRLYGPADIVVSGMSGTQYTKYILFRNGTVNAATGTLNLLIAHAENMMMDFVPVSVGSVLVSPTDTVTSMIVTAATDTAFTSPVSGTDAGNGHWSLAVGGLTTGATTTIYVKMRVNGEDKTTNGDSATGSNAYTSFAVTPQ
jgi:hypothetical protein